MFESAGRFGWHGVLEFTGWTIAEGLVREGDRKGLSTCHPRVRNGALNVALFGVVPIDNTNLRRQTDVRQSPQTLF
jgi:hypothetical protein